MSALDQDSLLAEARKRANLEDFGDTWFFKPMAVVLKAMREDARLSEQGAFVQRERLLTGLVNRLRMVDAIKKHPEIKDEKVTVAGVVLGLPRTGSTMLHRLLATAPGMTAIRWWETQNYAEFPGEERGKPTQRIETAKQIMAYMLQAVPDLTAIHPFAVDAPDEEVIILDQFFTGTMPQSTMYVPSYAEWMETTDQTPGYEDLKTVLKYLQWQDVRRRGKRWILKTPSNLSAADVVLKVFPESLLINTHRDPTQTIPSFCSMVDSLYDLNTTAVTPKEVGALTEKCWSGYLNRFAALRQRLGPDRFIDVRYEDQLADPLKQAKMVLNRVGVATNPEMEKIMQDWLAENAREKRAVHKYDMADFGLTAEQIRRDFAPYLKQFLQ